MENNLSAVQKFIAARIEELRLDGKSQKVIANEANYPNANMLSMIKQGDSKVSFERVLDLEQALELKRGTLLRMMLMEQFGEKLFKAIQDELSVQLPTHEQEIIRIVRSIQNPNFDDRAKRVLVAVLT